MSKLFASRLSLNRTLFRLFLPRAFVGQNRQALFWVLLGGLTARLAALPFAMTTEQDAVTRIDLSRAWLANPHWILDGIWLPLQTYYMAVAIWLTQDWQITPIMLNICFSVGTAIPLYFFTQREFGQAEAKFVATAFVLYPMAFRNSLMAMSDTPFLFFVAVSLWALSRARDPSSQQASDRDAWIAGVSLTLAAALRYEGWALIPPLALVLWHHPRQLKIFLSFALLTPLIWMAGNGLLRGDCLYSFKYQVADTAGSLVERGGMSPLKRFVRALFIPFTLAMGMTLPLFGLCCWGAVRQGIRRTSRAHWLLPFLFLLGLLCYKSISGTMNLQPRYSLTLGIFLLPFSASALMQLRSCLKPRWHRSLKFSLLLLLLPLSYMTHLFRPMLAWALSDTQMVKREAPASLMEAVPRLASSTQATIQLVRAELQPEDALFVAGLPEIGYLVLYPMGLTLSQLEIIPTGLASLPDRNKAEQFLERRPQGLLLVHAQTFAQAPLQASTDTTRGLGSHRSFNWQPTPSCSVRLRPVGAVEGAILYRYEVIHP